MKSLPPLASLIAGIKASATPATHKIVSSGPIPLSDMMPKREERDANLLRTVLAERDAAPTLAGPFSTPSPLAMAKKAERDAVTTPASQEVENLLRACREMEKELAIAGQARKEREARVLELESLLSESSGYGRSLSEALKISRDETAQVEAFRDQQRKRAEYAEADKLALQQRVEALTRELAEARNDRKAEARTLANVYALHFLGPQGTGTADRIKAVGGAWKFHRAAVKDQFAASGFWLMPDTGETNALCADLQAEGKSIRTAPV